MIKCCIHSGVDPCKVLPLTNADERKYHELWGKLGKHKELILHCAVEAAGTHALHVHNTLMQLSLNLCALMQAWCDNKALDTVIHTIPRCYIPGTPATGDRKSKDPFGTIRVAKIALSKTG